MPPDDGYSSPVLVDVEDIDPRPARDVRASFDPERSEEYAENLTKLPPLRLVIDPEGKHWLEDGYHRYKGHLSRGTKRALCVVRNGTFLDAFHGACGANDRHGIPTTNADKRRRVEVALKHPEMGKWSSSRIAEWCGVSDKTVASLRPEPTSENPKLVGRDGKARKAPTPRKPKPVTPDPRPTPSPPEPPPEKPNPVPGPTPEPIPSPEQTKPEPARKVTPEPLSDPPAETIAARTLSDVTGAVGGFLGTTYDDLGPGLQSAMVEFTIGWAAERLPRHPLLKKNLSKWLSLNGGD